MKTNIKYALSALMLAMTFTACEIDNYDQPEAAVEGVIINKVTGRPVECAQGTGNMKIRIVEKSFAGGDTTVVVTPQTLNVMQDGTFRNVHLFAGTYDMWPYETCCYESDSVKQEVVLGNGSTAKVRFEVTPYFEVEWVDYPDDPEFQNPWQDENGYVHALFKYTCNPLPDGDYTQAQPEYLRMYISTSVKVGTNSDGRYMPTDVRTDINSEGSELEMVTKNPIDFTQTFWVRMGVVAKANTAAGVYAQPCMSSIRQINAVGKPAETE